MIVTEIFDAGLFGENSLETLNHAWDHLLLDKEVKSAIPENENESLSTASIQKLEKSLSAVAKVIPQSADVFVVPIECERFRKYFRYFFNSCVKNWHTLIMSYNKYVVSIT